MSIVIDARDLEPPEPFERVMEALCDMQPGDDVVLVLTREPFPLYRVLERNGYAWQATGFDDGRFEIRIWEKSNPPVGG
jgi:uncharacterized protein (DUF2249 family)